MLCPLLTHIVQLFGPRSVRTAVAIMPIPLGPRETEPGLRGPVTTGVAISRSPFGVRHVCVVLVPPEPSCSLIPLRSDPKSIPSRTRTLWCLCDDLLKECLFLRRADGRQFLAGGACRSRILGRLGRSFDCVYHNGRVGVYCNQLGLVNVHGFAFVEGCSR